jgi:hypothetical protein
MLRLILTFFVGLNLTILTIIGYIQFPNPDVDIFFAAICAMITTAAVMAIWQNSTIKQK